MPLACKVNRVCYSFLLYAFPSTEATVVVAPDSGPAHIATTQGTPVIGLYGHSNPLRTGPYNNLSSVVTVYEKHVEQQHKKPISELPWSTRVKGDHIMADISVASVVQSFEQITQGK